MLLQKGRCCFPLIRVSSYFVREKRTGDCVEDCMEENVQFVRSQIDMAKRMNVVAVPSALIHGKVVLECHMGDAGESGIDNGRLQDASVRAKAPCRVYHVGPIPSHSS